MVEILKKQVQEDGSIMYVCRCAEYKFSFELKDKNIYAYVPVEASGNKVPEMKIWCSYTDYWPDEFYLELIERRIYPDFYADHIFYMQHGMTALQEVRKFFEDLKKEVRG